MELSPGKTAEIHLQNDRHVEGKLFATFVCGLKRELDDLDEVTLQEYCRCLCDDMLKDGSAFSPLVREHGTVSIRI